MTGMQGKTARQFASRRAQAGAWLALIGVAILVSGCEDVARRLADATPGAASTAPAPATEGSSATAEAIVSTDTNDVARRLAADGVVSGASAPGPGIVAGRVVDAVTGLPVPDAGVSLLQPGRRAITGADGAFRFEGIARGELTIVLGPADGYVTRGTQRSVSAQGLDAGLLALLPVGPATLVDPEFGGEVIGCRATRLSLPTGVIAEPLPISVTCIDRAVAFPAPPPVGRLPLAVVDVAPNAIPLAQPVPFVVELPAQPRYAPGVVLDILRLDAVSFAWQDGGTMVVDAGGRTAVGRLSDFGTYLVVAPPFGAFEARADAEPTIRRYNVSSSPSGAPSDVFPAGTLVVYAAFEYSGMDNTPIAIRTVDARGDVVWEASRPYAREGSDAAPMLAPESGAWPVGAYTTAWYVGDPPISVGGDVAWSITSRPTPAPTPFDEGVVASAGAGAGVGSSVAEETAGGGPMAQGILGGALAPSGGARGSRAGSSGIAGCKPPFGWWQYIVRPGDTLFGLSVRLGTDAGTLATANCLDAKGLFAGATIFVPQPPSKYLPPWKPAAATSAPPFIPPPSVATPWPTKVRAPIEPTLQPYPTTWYTPPAPLAPDNAPGRQPNEPGPSPAIDAPPARPPIQLPPAAPFASPTPVLPKDPAPSEPTLAPRPSP